MLASLALLSTAALLASAAPSSSNLDARSSPPAAIAHCPAGYVAGSVSNTAAFNVPMSTIIPVIDSFFDVTWEGFTLLSTTGKDNKAKATRSVSFQGVSLTEQLDSLVLTPHLVDRKWHGVGGEHVGGLPVEAPQYATNLISWTEHMVVSPVPAAPKKAHQWVWTATFCSTNDPVATSLFNGAHEGPLAAFAQQYGNYTASQ